MLCEAEMKMLKIVCSACCQVVQGSFGPTTHSVPCPTCQGEIELPSSSTQNEFWADKVKQSKQNGSSDEIIKAASKNIPLPAAFREIAIATRKDIRIRRKANLDTSDLLRKLYKWAVIENFFSDIQWNRILSDKILHSVSLSCIKGINTSYHQIGYKNLGLLNKTDLKWLVEAFGESEVHVTAQDANMVLWQKAVEAFSAAEQRDERHYWRSHGFEGPPVIHETSPNPNVQKPLTKGSG